MTSSWFREMVQYFDIVNNDLYCGGQIVCPLIEDFEFKVYTHLTLTDGFNFANYSPGRLVNAIRSEFRLWHLDSLDCARGILQFEARRDTSTTIQQPFDGVWEVSPPDSRGSLERKEFVIRAHEECGHGSTATTYRLLSAKAGWLGTREEVAQRVRSCPLCQTSFSPSSSSSLISSPLLSSPISSPILTSMSTFNNTEVSPPSALLHSSFASVHLSDGMTVDSEVCQEVPGT